MKKEYKTEEYKAISGFFYLYILLIFIIFLSVLIGRLLNIPDTIFAIWIICLFILPFIFERKIKLIFTKKVLLEFDDLSFSIKLFQSKNEKEEKQLSFNWSDIKSYKFYFTSSKNTILTLYFRNGAIKTWGFKDNKTSNEAIAGEGLFNIFHNYIKQYNLNKNNDQKIVLNLGLLNSKAGTFLIYSEIAIIISGFIFHLIMHPQSSFLTLLMGISLVTQQYFKRRQEKELYYKICKLD